MLQRTSWPQKTRELHNHHMDSTVWNDFPFRSDDIVIATYAKSGTTWMQQIVSQLIFEGAEGIDVASLSPWLDMRVLPRAETLAMLEAQTHRRFIKTHLPLDAFAFDPDAKYLYIARDGRDVAWSAHNHFAKVKDEFYDLLNDTPGRVGPPMPRLPADVRQFFIDWMEGDGAPLWSFWENVRTWWHARHLPNVMLVHFADLKADPERMIREIAAFLEIEVADALWPRILEHCSFDYMKRHAAHVVPLGGQPWEGGAGTFINKGTNGRWRDVLTAEDVSRYETLALAELGPQCANWLANGGPA
ncbi:sulfotransferase domain-containing protein [Sphingomonas tabacisoli]|uniref:Sulfotransferase domain-containing protein n=1 Tax=Sphingomonas tabacisoli TaxID=2249466 RepID=A0ABW4I0F5_9SPHN